MPNLLHISPNIYDIKSMLEVGGVDKLKVKNSKILNLLLLENWEWLSYKPGQRNNWWINVNDTFCKLVERRILWKYTIIQHQIER